MTVLLERLTKVQHIVKYIKVGFGFFFPLNILVNFSLEIVIAFNNYRSFEVMFCINWCVSLRVDNW